jgi:SAM-dependent methyltransferase
VRQLIRRESLGRIAGRLKRALVGPPEEYRFARKEAVDEIGRLSNVLEYAKRRGARYSARHFPAGYHTLRIDGSVLHGQRDPEARLRPVLQRLEGKTVLDIGCNHGGMLLAARHVISHGVGIDYDSRAVNAANRIRRITSASNLDFYVFDLECDPLALITDLIPDGRVDIVFMLSVAMWIKNWTDVVELAATISGEMLFETNGTEEQQSAQETQLRHMYEQVELVASASSDDPGQKRRRLFYAAKGT